MKEKTKQAQLFKLLRRQKLFSSAQVQYYGLTLYFKSAERRLREMVEVGLFRRLTRCEICQRGLWKPGQAPIAWYEIVR